MRFALLGPLQVFDGDAELRISGDKRRLLLTALLIEAGRPVSTERLIAALWGTSRRPRRPSRCTTTS